MPLSRGCAPWICSIRIIQRGSWISRGSVFRKVVLEERSAVLLDYNGKDHGRGFNIIPLHFGFGPDLWICSSAMTLLPHQDAVDLEPLPNQQRRNPFSAYCPQQQDRRQFMEEAIDTTLSITGPVETPQSPSVLSLSLGDTFANVSCTVQPRDCQVSSLFFPHSSHQPFLMTGVWITILAQTLLLTSSYKINPSSDLSTALITMKPTVFTSKTSTSKPSSISMHSNWLVV